jgi:hypothetical protein
MAIKQRRLRPSASSRWIACPGSVKLCAQVPYRPSGEAAQRGTAIHALAETCYQLDTDPMKFVGEEMEGVTLDADDCQMALDYLNEIWNIESVTERMNVEYPVKYQSKEYIQVGGTADLVGYSMKDGIVYVIDLKTGKGYVEEDNTQLKIYALAYIQGMSRDWIKEIHMTIVQPQSGEPRTHIMTIAEITEWEEKVLRPAMIATQLDDPPLYMSESACQWCDAKTICPKQKQQFDVVAKQQDITKLNKDEIAEVMKTLTPDQISAILDKAPMVEKFIKAVEEHALQAMEKDGMVLQGWQLQPKRATRKWLDGDKAADKLAELGLTRIQIFDTTLITPAAAEKLLPKENRVILDDLTVKISSGLTLARDRSLSQ